MSYYFSKIVKLSFEETITKVSDELQKEGFGILTEIDVKATFKKKLNVDFRNYKILGACNPSFAYEALKNEKMVGTMLPCNIVVQESENGKVDVAAVDPVVSMQAIENPNLKQIAEKVQVKLKKVIERV